MDFPDLPQLLKLREALWHWPRSRAAVMVGAGFSRNAEPLAGVTSTFPTWYELIEDMFKELNPGVKFDGSSFLKVASQYEALFNSAKLDELIKDKTPDSQFSPGILHQKLLQLPWSDVFTTNYDTLLERTDILGRVYTTVSHPRELTSAIQPRIVKLHGTFSAPSKLIITEEHFRRYPKEFAPFVNTVQQSLLENSFALIGFSGDDPNFLAWIGWIRDELADRHSPIYLVSPSAVTQAERALHKERGVTPIDFSPLLKGKTFPEGKHGAALHLFLNCLAAGRPWPRERWPEFEEQEEDKDDPLKCFVEQRQTVPKLSLKYPTHDKPITETTLEELYCRWKFERIQYPGWLVARKKIRSSVWDDTKIWLQQLILFLEKRAPVDRLLLFNELNWRLELSMVPLFEECVTSFRLAVDQLFDSVLSSNCPNPEFEFLSSSASPNKLVHAWLQVAFALLREARESYNASYWNSLKSKVDQVVEKYKLLIDNCFYESALWSLWNIDRSAARAILNKWQPSPRKPLTAIWKASLLAELDDLGEARILLRNALSDIRSAQKVQGQNIELLSLEGWCTFLLFGVESSNDFSLRSAVRKEFYERWHELGAWNCDPWPIREEFEQALTAITPTLAKEERKVRGFDPGEISISFHWSNEGIDPFIPGFSQIRLYEQAGIPMRLGRFNMAGKELKTACRWIAPFIGFWSPALLIRAGRLEDLIGENAFLSRIDAALMDEELVGRLIKWCAEIWEREVANLSSKAGIDPDDSAILCCLAEVMSRLCFRMDANANKDALVRALALHTRARYLSHSDLYDSIAAWFQRLYEATDVETLVEWLPDLLNSPLFDGAEKEHAWPNPLEEFPSEDRVRKLFSAGKSVPQVISDCAESLLKEASSKSGSVQEWAIWRLVTLDDANLLLPEQQTKLGEIIWSNTDADGLPNLLQVRTCVLLALPKPTSVDVVSLVKKKVLALDATYGGAVNGNVDGKLTTTSGLNPTSDLIYDASTITTSLIDVGPCGYVEWEPEEVKVLYARSKEWWQFAREAFERKFSGFGGLNKCKAGSIIGKFLCRVVLPNADEWFSEQDWQDVLAWYQELKSLDVHTSFSLPYVLIGRAQEESFVRKQIVNGLSSSNEKEVADAADATLHWCFLNDANVVVPPATEAIDYLIRRVVYREKPGINECLVYLTLLVANKSNQLSLKQLELLIGGLDAWRRATAISRSEHTSSEFDEEERPDLRRAVGLLAGALSAALSSTNTGELDLSPLSRWAEACLVDALPEVRRAFVEGAELVTVKDKALMSTSS